MDFKSFQELSKLVKAFPKKTGVAVAMAQDYHTLEAVSRAAREGLIQATLLGVREEITAILNELDEPADRYTILDEPDAKSCMRRAAQLVHDGKAGAIMKGKMETGQIMKGILDRENGLRKSGLISLTGFYESPYYHKMFAVTDQAINIAPDLEGKKGILENAVDAMHMLGNPNPKVACLCAVEKVNPKMPETGDAAALKEMNRKGEITGCIVEGPISLDLAMVRESASIKGYESPVAGDADLMVVPDLVSGNLMVKAITEVGGGQTGGLVLGARVPVILVSRAATAEDKFNSIALAAYIGNQISGKEQRR